MAVDPGVVRKHLSLLRTGRFAASLQSLGRAAGFRHLLFSSPSSLMIEPTNACNLRCPTCPTGSGKMRRPKRMMSLDEFRHIVNQARHHVYDTRLWNYGEPFLNRDLVPMIEYAASAGMYVRTSTNGEFFGSDELCERLVRSGLQYLIVCLDGADQTTIEQFRVGSSFEEILSGLRRVHEVRRRLNSPIPTIELQFIVMRHNEHQRELMEALARDLEIDVYCEKTVGIDYNDPDFQRLARDLLPTDLSLSQYSRADDGTLVPKGELPRGCSRIFREATINSDGSVVPCCYDLYSDFVMGNVFDQPLSSIWRNQRYHRFRATVLRDRRSIPMCRACPEDRYEIRSASDRT